MSESTTYEIVLRGRPSARLLRPFIDDFTIDICTDTCRDDATGVATRLVGDICDPAHLNGVLAHLTSVNVEVISIAPHRSSHEDRSPTDHSPTESASS
jgi:hypothetical protein